jgi:hypothetical protein
MVHLRSTLTDTRLDGPAVARAMLCLSNVIFTCQLEQEIYMVYLRSTLTPGGVMRRQARRTLSVPKPCDRAASS